MESICEESKMMIIQPNSLGQFRKLKKYLLNHILAFLSLADILEIKNKEIFSLLFPEKAKIAKEHLSREIKDLLSTTFTCEPDRILEIAMPILTGSPSIIPILGYMATGSFQSQNKTYHYTNLFKLNKSIHCSDYENPKNNKYYGVLAGNYLDNKPFVLYDNDKKNFNAMHVMQLAEKLRYKDLISLTIPVKLVRDMCNSHPIYYYSSAPKKGYITNDPIWNYAEEFNNKFPNSDEIYSSFPNDNSSVFDDNKILDQYLQTFQNLPEYTFVITNIYIDNDYHYTCPLKTFALFVHEKRELNESDNYFLSLFNDVDSFEKLSVVAKKVGFSMIISSVQKNDQIIHTKETWESDDDDVEDNDKERKSSLNIACELAQNKVKRTSERQKEKLDDVFIEFDLSEQREQNLKIVCWGNLHYKASRVFNLRRMNHSGKFMVALFISANCRCKDTIDCSKFLLFGIQVPKSK